MEQDNNISTHDNTDKRPPNIINTSDSNLEHTSYQNSSIVVQGTVVGFDDTKINAVSNRSQENKTAVNQLNTRMYNAESELSDVSTSVRSLQKANDIAQAASQQSSSQLLTLAKQVQEVQKATNDNTANTLFNHVQILTSSTAIRDLALATEKYVLSLQKIIQEIESEMDISMQNQVSNVEDNIGKYLSGMALKDYAKIGTVLPVNHIEQGAYDFRISDLNILTRTGVYFCNSGIKNIPPSTEFMTNKFVCVVYASDDTYQNNDVEILQVVNTGSSTWMRFSTAQNIWHEWQQIITRSDLNAHNVDNESHPDLRKMIKENTGTLSEDGIKKLRENFLPIYHSATNSKGDATNDLNTLLTSGVYFCSGSAYLNTPDDDFFDRPSAFVCLVYRSDERDIINGNVQLTQTIITGLGGIYTRMFVGSTFTPWSKIASMADLEAHNGNSHAHQDIRDILVKKLDSTALVGKYLATSSDYVGGSDFNTMLNEGFFNFDASYKHIPMFPPTSGRVLILNDDGNTVWQYVWGSDGNIYHRYTTNQGVSWNEWKSDDVKATLDKFKLSVEEQIRNQIAAAGGSVGGGNVDLTSYAKKDMIVPIFHTINLPGDSRIPDFDALTTSGIHFIDNPNIFDAPTKDYAQDCCICIVLASDDSKGAVRNNQIIQVALSGTKGSYIRATDATTGAWSKWAQLGASVTNSINNGGGIDEGALEQHLAEYAKKAEVLGINHISNADCDVAIRDINALTKSGIYFVGSGSSGVANVPPHESYQKYAFSCVVYATNDISGATAGNQIIQTAMNGHAPSYIRCYDNTGKWTDWVQQGGNSLTASNNVVPAFTGQVVHTGTQPDYIWATVDGDKKLHLLSLADARNAIIGGSASQLPILSARVNQVEAEQSNILLKMKMDNDCPDSNLLIYDNFAHPTDTDLFNVKVTAVTAGNNTIQVQRLSGIYIGAWYWITDGVSQEQVQVEYVSRVGSVNTIFVKTPIKNTYNIDNTTLYRTTAGFNGGVAIGSAYKKSIVWDVNTKWQGSSEHSQTVSTVDSSLNGASNFTTTRCSKFTADGFMTIDTTIPYYPGVGIVLMQTGGRTGTWKRIGLNE